MILGFEILLPTKPGVTDDEAALALKEISDAISLDIFENVQFQIVTDGGKVAGLTDEPKLTLLNGGKGTDGI